MAHKCGTIVKTATSLWFQKTITLAPKKRGIHVITDEITQIPEIKNFSIGIAHIMIKHTSASLSLNECWDSDVKKDMETILNRIVPENAVYEHTIEGPDDMPAHGKTSLMGASVTIPITDGALNLGTWQGIWLNEHRNHAGSRNLVVTLQGVGREII
ncbi:hypothetical protein LOD99_463 [Oopsacas minuta]|uniref:Uncharacterized protein n=1 Tax=Oopsacas minuta TaxID=111878 RepID=A0AAV7K8Z5_9METZ|nr:hypothetical protein LOD99_463 [Oopsacas minuta]